MPSAPEQGIGNGQRAFWTFLFYTLCGPFFAALGYTAAVALAPLFKLAALLPATRAPLGEAIAGVFVWSAIPAALTALILAPLVYRRGTFGWIEAAASAVIAFAAAAAFAPIPDSGSMPFLAFLAGLVSLAVRHVLLAANILRSPLP